MMSDKEKVFNLKNGKEIKDNKDLSNLKGTIKSLITQVVSLRKKKENIDQILQLINNGPSGLEISAFGSRR